MLSQIYLIKIELDVFRKHKKVLYYVKIEEARRPTHTRDYGGPQDDSGYCKDRAKSSSNSALWRPLPETVAPLWSLPVVFGWCSRRTHSLLASQLPHIVVLITKALAFQLALSTPSPPSGHHHHPHTSPLTILDHPRPVTDAVVVINRNFIPFYTPVRKAGSLNPPF